MIDFDLTLRSESVLLRPLEMDDLHQYEGLTGDSSMWIYFINDLSDKKELQGWVDEGVRLMKNRTRLTFTTIDTNTGKVIGSTAFGNISERDKRVEIGWTWLAKNYHGTGVNSQVKYLMLKYCFEDSDFERVELKTDVLNKPARGAMLKIGLTEEGTLRSHTLMTRGRRRDTIYYSVLRHEWNEMKMKNNWV